MSKLLPKVLFVSLFYGAISLPSQAQLPNTNMGRFVHQPGDNQYTNQTQEERHGAPTPVMQAPVKRQAAPSAANTPAAAGPAAPYVLTPKPQRPDISLLPIVADEPIKPAGFPPLPDRLDLPVSSGWTRESVCGGVKPNGPAGAAVTGQNYPDISKPQGVHQHYVHYQPGAFQTLEQRQQGHPTEASISNGSAPAGRGYYKASDSYNINPGANPNSAAAPVSGTVQAIRQLGNEPTLNSRNDAPAQPDAPTPLAVNQSTTQDLSLPEDDFAKQSPQSQNNRGKQTSRMVSNMAVRTLYYGAAMGYSMARYR